MKTIVKLLSSQCPTHRSGHMAHSLYERKFWVITIVDITYQYLSVLYQFILPFLICRYWLLALTQPFGKLGTWCFPHTFPKRVKTTVLGIFVKLLGTEPGIWVWQTAYEKYLTKLALGEKWKPRSSKNIRRSASPRVYCFLKTSVSIFSFPEPFSNTYFTLMKVDLIYW